MPRESEDHRPAPAPAPAAGRGRDEGGRSWGERIFIVAALAVKAALLFVIFR